MNNTFRVLFVRACPTVNEHALVLGSFVNIRNTTNSYEYS